MRLGQNKTNLCVICVFFQALPNIVIAVIKMCGLKNYMLDKFLQTNLRMGKIHYTFYVNAVLSGTLHLL